MYLAEQTRNFCASTNQNRRGRFGRFVREQQWWLVAVIVILVWLPFLQSPRVNNDGIDWNYRANYFGYQINAIVKHHELPFWVTSARFEQLRAKGVHDFFANPETDVFSLITLFAPFGFFVAVKIALVLALVVGVYGCHECLWVFGTGRWPSFWATLWLSLLVLCNGSFGAHIIVGHVQFITTAILPLAGAYYVKAWNPARSRRSRAFSAASAGAILAVAYYSGNTHPLIHFVVVFASIFTALSVAMRPRSWSTVLPAAIVTSVSFFVLSAFKLLPGLVDFRQYRRDYFIHFDGWTNLAERLVTPWHGMTGDNWPEHYLYVGWVGVAALAVAFTALNRRTVPLIGAAAFMSWLMVADEKGTLVGLPIFRTQGAVTRFAMVAFIALATAAMVRLNELLALARRSRDVRVRNRVLALVSILGIWLAFDLSQVNFAEEVAISCKHRPLDAVGPFDESPKFVTQDSRHANVTTRRVTANTFSYEVPQPDPSTRTLVVASDLPVRPRWPHLRLKGPGELTTWGGQLAVRLPAGASTFTLTFFDPLVICGLAISLSGWVALIWLGWRPRRQPSTVLRALQDYVQPVFDDLVVERAAARDLTIP